MLFLAFQGTGGCCQLFDGSIRAFCMQALQGLTLTMPPSMMHQLWPAMGDLSRLRTLWLSWRDNIEELNAGSMLRGLTSLTRLCFSDWKGVTIEDGGSSSLPLLPALWWLQVTRGREVVVNAHLPCLQTFRAADMGRVQLAGPNLALPALRCLDLSRLGYGEPLKAEVDFRAMPGLETIESNDVEFLSAEGLSALQKLSSLELACHLQATADSAALLVRACPPSLRRLGLGFLDVEEQGLGAALATMTQLTALELYSPDAVHLMRYLGGLRQLQEIELPVGCQRLAMEYRALLTALPTLKRVAFSPTWYCG